MDNKYTYVIEYENHTKNDFEDVWNIENNYLEPNTISTVEQVMERDKVNNEIHIFCRNLELNKIVGEITLLPLDKSQFLKFMKNQLEDTELDAKKILTYKQNMNCYLLFSVIAIDRKYRDDKYILSYLLTGLYNKINKLQNAYQINILNICAEGQTKEGQKFLENFLNLKCKSETEKEYKLYSFDNSIDFDNWLKKFPKYINEYNINHNLINKKRESDINE